MRPPALCLVMELCAHGSLFDILYSNEQGAIAASNKAPAAQITPIASLVPRAPPQSPVIPQQSAQQQQQQLLLQQQQQQARSRGQSELSIDRDYKLDFDYRPPTIALTWTNRLLIAWQCAKAVACLHDSVPPVLHLDLKSGNFLLAFVPDREVTRSAQAASDLCASIASQGCNFEVKVADLELSSSVESSEVRKRLPDTINWSAPEVIATRMNLPSSVFPGYPVTTKADCFSLGCVLYELLCRQIPFASSRSRDAYHIRDRRASVEGDLQRLPLRIRVCSLVGSSRNLSRRQARNAASRL